MPSFCVPKNSSFTTRSGSFFVPVISIFGITTKEGLRPPLFVSFSSLLVFLLAFWPCSPCAIHNIHRPDALAGPLRGVAGPLGAK